VRWLRWIEVVEWCDLRGDRIAEFRIRGLLGLLGDFALGLVVGEDNRAILGAVVNPLAVQGGGVVGLPEMLEQRRIVDLLGIEDNLDDLRMPGLTSANLLIGRIPLVSTGIARRDGLDPVEGLEQSFHAPEASTAESCLLFVVAHA